MHRVITAALLASVFNLAAASDQRPLIEPKNTGLVVARVERKEALFAEFEGRTWITGTLVAQWGLDVDEDMPDFKLVPDAASIRRLPYFADYPLRQIDIENGAEALRMAVGSAMATRLQSKRIRVVRAKGTFLITQYIVGVECDAPWARAVVVEAKVPQPPRTDGTPDPFDC